MSARLGRSRRSRHFRVSYFDLSEPAVSLPIRITRMSASPFHCDKSEGLTLAEGEALNFTPDRQKTNFNVHSLGEGSKPLHFELLEP